MSVEHFQEKRNTLIEAFVTALLGLLASMIVFHFMFPNISVFQNIHYAVWASGSRFIVGYLCRRYFTKHS